MRPRPLDTEPSGSEPSGSEPSTATPTQRSAGELVGASAPAKLSLYYYEYCVYCEDVRRELRRLGIEVQLRNTRKHPQYEQELIASQGRATVPVLMIEAADGSRTWLPESLAIIATLRSLRPELRSRPLWVIRVQRHAHLVLLALSFVLDPPLSYLALALAVAVWGLRRVTWR